MKLLTCCLLLALIPLKWGTDFESAKKDAKEKKQMILLNFSGSDWCAPCVATKRDFFENDSFIAMAKDNLVLLNADFPRKKKNQLSPEQTKKMRHLPKNTTRRAIFRLRCCWTPTGKS